MAGCRFSTYPGGSFRSIYCKLILQLIFAVALSATVRAQTVDDSVPQAPSASQSTPESPTSETTHIVIPVGTRIPLVLTHPLDSNSVKTGDAVFAQIATPVVVEDHVAVPAGTFVRGKVESLTRRGTRAEVTMRSASLVMGSALVDIGGPVKIESEEWTAYNNPTGRKKAAIILAPLIGSGLGMAIGAATDRPHTTTLGSGFSIPSGGFGGLPGPSQTVPPLTITENSHTGLFVGSAVGGAVGLVTSLTLMGRNKQFYLEEGTPLEITLSNPVALTRAQVGEAEHNTAPVQVIHRRRSWPGPGNNPSIGFPGSTPASGPASCSAGQSWCMGSCKSTIDFMNDNNNCGSCGNSCRIGESCTGGSCMKQP